MQETAPGSDIQSRSDIELLVKEFYEKLLVDELIGHFFTEVVHLDLEEHLPRICDFWESILLGKAVFHGNPMTKHFALHAKSPMQHEHFERWLEFWEKSVNARFAGKNATEAIRRAQQIGQLMEFQVSKH